jgi:hypothetical protein
VLVPATPALRRTSAYWFIKGFTRASLAEVRF